MRRVGWAPYLLAPALGLGFAGALLALDDRNGLPRLLSLRDRAEVLRGDLGALRADRIDLLRAVESLRSDPFAVERLARERLGLVRPDDLVIRLGPPDLSPD